jgi:hypothetical protein
MPIRGSHLENIEKVALKLDVLTPKIVELDNRRWKGEEWERGDLPFAKRVFFGNTEGMSPDQRLSAFWYCCLLDRQVAYEKAWGEGLRKVIKYLEGSAGIPSLRLDESGYFRASKKAFGNKVDGFSHWLIMNVSVDSRPERGSLYRLVGVMGRELLGVQAGDTKELLMGKPGLLGRWKRLWMAVMLLRRDQKFLKGLIEEAASSAEEGQSFLRLWYGGGFSETECELPVDSRVFNFFRVLGLDAKSLAKTAWVAHEWGERNGVSPSALDVAFVPGFNQEIYEYGLHQGLDWSQWWGRR